MIIDKKYLLRAIKSEYEIVAVWGAYQILQLPNNELEEYMPFFLESSVSDIKDVGISKIAELNINKYTSEIIRIFRESSGRLKYSAAFALSYFPNDISISLIQKWFNQLSASDQSTRIEFEAATFSLLRINRNESFDRVLHTLISLQQDVIKSSVLFTNLLNLCDTESDFKAIIDQYFILRDLHSDAELTYHLIENITKLELKNWWADNLSKGYSVSSIYKQCYSLLGFKDSITEQQLWHEIEESYIGLGKTHDKTPANHNRFISAIGTWVKQLLKSEKSPELRKLIWMIKGFERNEEHFTKTIPKILDMESHFLLTLPLNIILERSVTLWLKEPIQHVENIANYYHSTLLLKRYREKILSLFFPVLPDWTPSQVKIINHESPLNSENNTDEILWMFYRGELLGYEIPWPSIFPNPAYSMHLVEGLRKIYLHNFAYYINKKDRVSVDYALQLFQLKPDKDAIDIIIRHFEYLGHYHADLLYQTIEYLPDPAFISLLLTRYEKGEYEIARLIFLISEIFEINVPEDIIDDLDRMGSLNMQNSGINKPIRLHCSSCNNTFQYPVDMIYIDEGSMLRMNRLSNDSAWTPQKFICKKCSSEVPFFLDDSQLEELSFQSRIDRILRISTQTKNEKFSYKICLIDFPRHDGRTYTPDDFRLFISDIERKTHMDKDELKSLWIKQARLEKTMENWNACKNTLEKIRSIEKIDEEWMFIMGFVSYKLSLFADARKYFDWIVKKHPRKSEKYINEPFIEQSKYFLKALDSNTSKRARFKVIKKEK
ncbi:hypothetical protein KKA14_03080 [bacterium]|nr:hypothetical protein [bacterium]